MTTQWNVRPLETVRWATACIILIDRTYDSFDLKPTANQERSPSRRLNRACIGFLAAIAAAIFGISVPGHVAFAAQPDITFAQWFEGVAKRGALPDFSSPLLIECMVTQLPAPVDRAKVKELMSRYDRTGDTGARQQALALETAGEKLVSRFRLWRGPEASRGAIDPVGHGPPFDFAIRSDEVWQMSGEDQIYVASAKAAPEPGRNLGQLLSEHTLYCLELPLRGGFALVGLGPEEAVRVPQLKGDRWSGRWKRADGDVLASGSWNEAEHWGSVDRVEIKHSRDPTGDFVVTAGNWAWNQDLSAGAAASVRVLGSGDFPSRDIDIISISPITQDALTKAVATPSPGSVDSDRGLVEARFVTDARSGGSMTTEFDAAGKVSGQVSSDQYPERIAQSRVRTAGWATLTLLVMIGVGFAMRKLRRTT